MSWVYRRPPQAQYRQKRKLPPSLFSEGAALATETLIRPVSDVTVAGWDTAPTGSDPLWEQLDEVSPSDTDYIFAESPV